MEVDKDDVIKLEVPEEEHEQFSKDELSQVDTITFLNDLVSEARQISLKALEASKWLNISGDICAEDEHIKSFLSSLSRAEESLNISISALKALLLIHTTKNETALEAARLKFDKEMRYSETNVSKVESYKQETKESVKYESDDPMEEDDLDFHDDHNYQPKHPGRKKASQDVPSSDEDESAEKIFSCTKCEFKASKQKYLQDHLNGGLKYRVCPLCGIHLRYMGKDKKKGQVEAHIKDRHPDFMTATGIKCGACEEDKNKEFSTVWQLHGHMAESHDLKANPHCPDCNFSATSMNAMKLHMAKHKAPKQKKMTARAKIAVESEENNICNVCGKSFGCVKYLRKHIKDVHSEKKFLCEDCDFKSASLNVMKRHRNRKHLGWEEYPCGQCELRFKTIKALSQHVFPAHGGHKYRCDQCTFSSRQEFKLKEHMAIHSGEGALFSCNDCEYQTHSKKCYEHHRMKHEGMTYKCQEPGCNYSTTYKVHLKTHHSSAHQGIRYACDQCGLSYTQQGSLNDHIRRIHQEKVSFSCQYCDFTSKYKTKLKHHVESIHKGKKYPCEQCEYVATRYDSLATHRQTVHNKVRHCCTLCSFSSPRKYKLKKHLQIVHSKTEKLDQ